MADSRIGSGTGLAGGTGFSGGIGTRLVLAGGVGVVGLLAVLLVESGAGPVASPNPVATAAQSAVGPTFRLRIDATFPVVDWTILCAGIPVAGGSTTATSWEGAVASGSGQVLVEPADPLLGPGALRLHWSDGRPDAVVWGEGSFHAEWGAVRP